MCVPASHTRKHTRDRLAKRFNERGNTRTTTTTTDARALARCCFLVGFFFFKFIYVFFTHRHRLPARPERFWPEAAEHDDTLRIPTGTSGLRTVYVTVSHFFHAGRKPHASFSIGSGVRVRPFDFGFHAYAFVDLSGRSSTRYRNRSNRRYTDQRASGTESIDGDTFDGLRQTPDRRIIEKRFSIIIGEFDYRRERLST